MKKVLHVFLIILTLAFLISVSSNYTAYAACNYQNALGVDYNCHYLEYGVNSRGYYINSTASTYTSNINNAISNWNSASSDVYFYTGNNTSSPVRFFLGTVADSNSPGQTIMYASASSTTAVDHLTRNWSYAKIICSSTMFSDMSTSSRQGTCAHEFGHALGLNHMMNLQGGIEPNWIMTTYLRRSTYRVDSQAVLVVDGHLY